jgi:hypothetical protein
MKYSEPLSRRDAEEDAEKIIVGGKQAFLCVLLCALRVSAVLIFA